MTTSSIEAKKPQEKSAGGPAAGKPRIARRIVGPAGLLCLVLLILALTGGDYFLSVLTTAVVFGIAGIGLSLLGGTLRVVNLGASAFIGTGAFTAAYCNQVLGTDLIISLLAAMGSCVVLGGLVAPIASRLNGIYMAIITVGVAFLAQYIFRLATPWTGGSNGVQLASVKFLGHDIDQPVALGPITLSSARIFFVVAAVLLVLVATTSTTLLKSRIGRAWFTVGESPITARSFGMNPSYYRALAIVHSSALAGLAGGLLALTSGFVSWDQFDLVMSVNLLAVVVLGGLGSVYGVIAASAVLYTLPVLVSKCASFLPFVTTDVSRSGLSPEQFTTTLYGIALVLVMVLEPGGFAAIVRRARARISHHLAHDERNA